MLMADERYKRIDQFQVGDLVLSRDEDASAEEEILAGRVSKVFVHENKQVLRLRLGENVLDTTAEHPFYVVGQGWVFAAVITLGDVVVAADGVYHGVTGKEYLPQFETVYNIEVEGLHTYFVGSLNIWVHNKKQSVDLPLIWNPNCGQTGCAG